jgi:hypothetical protein
MTLRPRRRNRFARRMSGLRVKEFVGCGPINCGPINCIAGFWVGFEGGGEFEGIVSWSTARLAFKAQ